MKIKDYLYKHRLSQAQMARDLDISYRYFNFVVNEQKALPKKYWTKIIVYSQGEITIEDLINLKELYETYSKSPDGST